MRKPYRPEEIEFLKEYHPTHHLSETYKAFCEKFGDYTLSQVKHRIYQNGIRSIYNGQIQKGNEPWNKGISIKTERPDVYESLLKREKSKGNESTWFKPLEEGTERVRSGRVYIKTGERWTPKARYMYEQYHNVKLKKDEVIIFLNGDMNDFSVDNLFKTTNGAIVAMNQRDQRTSDKELTKASALTAMIEQRIQKLEEKEIHVDENQQ